MKVKDQETIQTSVLLNAEERRSLEETISNGELSADERVLAWAKLNAWGNGREFACCRVADLKAPRAEAIFFPVYRKEDIPAARKELIAASQHQCAFDLNLPVQRVRTATARLVKQGLLTTRWVESRSLVTKHKLGKGFRAHFAHAWVRAFYPVA